MGGCFQFPERCRPLIFMNYLQHQYYNASRRVRLVLKDSRLATHAGFTKIEALLADNEALVEANLPIQLADLSSFTEARQNMRSLIMGKIRKIAGALDAYIMIESKPETDLTGLSLAATPLAVMSDLVMSSTLEMVIGKATKYTTDLASYMVSAEELTTCASLAGSLRSLADERTTMLKKRVNATRHIKEAADKIAELLRGPVERLMQSIRYEMTDLFADFETASHIVYPNRVKKTDEGDQLCSVTVRVVNANTGEPEPDVTVMVDGTSLQDLTDDDGVMLADGLQPPHAIFLLAKDEFITQRVELHNLVAGDDRQIEVRMVPEGAG